MDNALFFVTEYQGAKYKSGAARPLRYKLEIRKKFAGKKIRRFFDDEQEAYSEGRRLTGQIQEKGTSSLEVHGKLVSEAIKQFWRYRGPSLKGLHRRHMERVLGDFGQKFGRYGMNAIGTKELHSFWDREEWPEGKSARRQAFAYVRIFLNWAERYDLIDRNPIRKVDPPKAPDPLTNIITPDGLKTLFEKAADMPDIRAYLALGAFAGLRTDEIQRIRPHHMDWAAGEIEVPSGKTGRRYVAMIPPFVRYCPKEWTEYAEERTFRRHREKLVERMGWKCWPDNCLRHTFATYLLAKEGDAPKVAHQMGHSDPKMVNKVYALPAKKADWQAWWTMGEPEIFEREEKAA